MTEEIAGTPTSLDLVHLKVSRDFDVLVDAKGEKLRPISLSFDVSSDLRKNHRVAGETKIWFVIVVPFLFEMRSYSF